MVWRRGAARRRHCPLDADRVRGAAARVRRRLSVARHSTAALTAVRFAIAFAVLIVPTMMMGATLPLVIRSSGFRGGSLGGPRRGDGRRHPYDLRRVGQSVLE